MLERGWLSTKDASLCGSFGRASVIDVVLRGKVSRKTLRMASGKAEAAHQKDVERQGSLVLRACSRAAGNPKVRRSVLRYLELAPTLRISVKAFCVSEIRRRVVEAL